MLISLALVADGAAVTAAVTWGLQQGRSSFQLVVMSLFEVVLAEVLPASDQRSAKQPFKPFVKVSLPLRLSPLREEECMSTHPKQRPEQKEGIERHPSSFHEMLKQSNRSRTDFYPGFTALVNFFDVAARRRSADKSTGRLPPELFCHILDKVDYDTWRTCSAVSPAFRSYCHLKYRIDDEWRIALTPAPQGSNNTALFSFDVENMFTRETIRLTEVEDKGHCHGLPGCNWMPIVGDDPSALMVNVLLEFQDDDEADGNDTDGSIEEA